jgi:hypothetical protein
MAAGKSRTKFKGIQGENTQGVQMQKMGHHICYITLVDASRIKNYNVDYNNARCGFWILDED